MTVPAFNKTKETALSYQLVTSGCKTHGAEGFVVFGVKIMRSADDFAEIKDISANREDVEQFLLKLKKGKVEPGQLTYLAEDYLVELSTR